jgi:methylenetetrahydrofolate dehydrogenase (NADP+) / methenyltetrahydrofolate cyclohydrolase / formyltetrahydrofolate synthetase
VTRGDARLLLGGPIAGEIRVAVTEDVEAFRARTGHAPGLAIVIVGRDAPSTVYLQQIMRSCEAVGIHRRLIELEGEATERRVTEVVAALNADPLVHGIIVQMPLPPSIRLRAVIDAIDPAKDIDGIHPLNAGLLRLGYDGFLPATAHAAVEILRRSAIEIEGRRAVVVGRSTVVGMPTAFLLVRENATVTVCHSRTRDLKHHVKDAEILVVAAGHPGRGRQAGRRRRLRIGAPCRVGHHAGPRWGRAADERPPARPPHASRARPGVRCGAIGGCNPGARDPGRRGAVHSLIEPRGPMTTTFPSDLEIARSVTPRPIADIASDLGLRDDEIELYGRSKAKVTLPAIERLERDRPRGRYVVVTAITPTPLGEGKSTTTVGLGQGLNHVGHRAAICIRQPSLGPVFGIKGGAAGGGYSQVIPMEDFNLHLTGDVHAIGAAHNLAAAFLDNSLHHGNPHAIDPFSILWPRVVDISDRTVRRAVIGLGGKENGVPRETEWVITVASEVMAVLALATDLRDLRGRLGRIVLATTKDGKAVTCEDLGVAGSMTVLLIDAIKPNLLQTLEGGPAFVHCGPFANIAHGNNSIIADRLALATNDIVATEAGFGADMGAEKFFDIKCRASGLAPDAAVVVATVRALKMHGGVGKIVAGKPLDPALLEENVTAVRTGAANLAKQIENVTMFGVPAVVAINSFPTDTTAEVEAIREVALEAGADDAVVATHFTDGGPGAADLANAVWAAASRGSTFQLLYPDDAPLGEKILAIATKVYGADGIELLPPAKKALKLYEDLGFGRLPVCMAKTQYSLSHDANLKGRPSGFTVTVRDIRLSAGAGFITPLLGEMRTMPGLPSRPGGEKIDIDADGNIVGLF